MSRFAEWQVYNISSDLSVVSCRIPRGCNQVKNRQFSCETKWSSDCFFRLVVKKRYQDFQALQKSLSEIHKSLYLDGKFPELPKISKGYFRKSLPSPNVEESLEQCQKLLEFCSKFPALCNSKIFTAFFADLESPKTDLESPEPDGPFRGDDAPDCEIVGRNAEVVAFGAIRDLARKGNIFEAAAVSTSLVINISPFLNTRVREKGNFTQREKIGRVIFL